MLPFGGGAQHRPFFLLDSLLHGFCGRQLVERIIGQPRLYVPCFRALDLTGQKMNLAVAVDHDVTLLAARARR